MKRTKTICATALLLLLPVLFDGAMQGQGGPPWGGQGRKPWEEQKQRRQDEIGGLPPEILARQSLERVAVPSIDEAVKNALAAAESAAAPLDAAEA
ncbi:MAG: hypothetical protein ACE5GW_03295, partial [Planctomycetota bacterium]